MWLYSLLKLVELSLVDQHSSNPQDSGILQVILVLKLLELFQVICGGKDIIIVNWLEFGLILLDHLG